MNRHPGLMLILLLLPFVAAGLFFPKTTQADPVECSASVSSINFGSVDSTATGNHDTTATLTGTCTKQSYYTAWWVTVCYNISNGPLGLDANGRRQIQGPGGNLPFQIYKNASRTIVWGSHNSTTYPDPVYRVFYMGGGAPPHHLSIPVYARLFAPLPTATTGNYTTTFTYPQVSITGLLTSYEPSNPAQNCANAGDDTSFLNNLAVQATIQALCHVDATDMNFGTLNGLLNSNRETTSSLSITCTQGTAYNVGLDNGEHYANGYRRMAGPNGNYVKYQLYRNANRTQLWGNTIGTDTVTGTGTGSTQNLTVWGRVPPQTTPPAGNYSDTIQVTITY